MTTPRSDWEKRMEILAEQKFQHSKDCSCKGQSLEMGKQSIFINGFTAGRADALAEVEGYKLSVDRLLGHIEDFSKINKDDVGADGEPTIEAESFQAIIAVIAKFRGET